MLMSDDLPNGLGSLTRSRGFEVLASQGKCRRIPEFSNAHVTEQIASDLASWLIARQHQL